MNRELNVVRHKIITGTKPAVNGGVRLIAIELNRYPASMGKVKVTRSQKQNKGAKPVKRSNGFSVTHSENHV